MNEANCDYIVQKKLDYECHLSSNFNFYWSILSEFADAPHSLNVKPPLTFFPETWPVFVE